MGFEAIPILDLSEAQKPELKSAFLEKLRYALLEVGFLYIKNTGIDPQLVQRVIEQGKRFSISPSRRNSRSR